MLLKIHTCFILHGMLLMIFLIIYQALVARLLDVSANIGIISGVLVTVGDLARVVSKFSFVLFILIYFDSVLILIGYQLIWVVVLFREGLQ